MNSSTSILSRVTSDKKTFVVMAAFSATILAMSVIGGQALAALGGPTCTVGAGQDYATIQSAVDVAGCSTIKVAAGTYTENVTIARSVVLKGAKFGTGVNGRTFGSAAESKVTGLLTINAADVTVAGFSLTNPGQGIAVTVKTAGNNANIKDNFVDTVGGAAFNDNSVGIYLETGPDNVKIEKNKIGHIQSGTPGSAQGILVGDSTSANPSLGIRILGNTIGDITSGAKGAYGIQINNGAKSPTSMPSATGYTTVKIRENTIKNLTGNWAHGIGLEGDTPNAIVTQNVISNLVDTNPVPAPDQIAVNFEDNMFFFTADVSRNSLAVGPTAVGVYVNPALTALYPTLNVDATCNWWGAANGPKGLPGVTATGSGSYVGVGADFSPWLKSANLSGKCKDNNNHENHHDNDNHHWNHDNEHDNDD